MTREENERGMEVARVKGKEGSGREAETSAQLGWPLYPHRRQLPGSGQWPTEADTKTATG